MSVLCTIEEARTAGTLRLITKKTKYHEYQFLVRSQSEIDLNVYQNVSVKPTGGEYFSPLFAEKYRHGFPSLSLEDLNKEDIWIDAGAHIGLFATRMLTQFPRIQKVIAYEPFPANIEFAKANLILNNVADRCEIVEKALVPNDDTETNLYLSTDSGKHSTLHINKRQITTVSAENINVAISKGTCLKMDVEGLEYDLIKAVRDWSNIRIAIIEYHFHYTHLSKNREEKFEEIMQIMRNNFDRIYVNALAASSKHFITHFAAVKL